MTDNEGTTISIIGEVLPAGIKIARDRDEIFSTYFKGLSPADRTGLLLQLVQRFGEAELTPEKTAEVGSAMAEILGVESVTSSSR
jgi:hypothetical protein